MSGAPRKLVKLGRVSGLLGVKGWIKVHSYTIPRENIVAFEAWILCRGGCEEPVALEAGRTHGKGVAAKLQGIDDRDRARALVGAEIAVEREALPPCAPGEYYWADLEGLVVETLDGTPLGEVDHLLATGVHDVLVLAGEPERLIPFVLGATVREVKLDRGVIVVDWDASF